MKQRIVATAALVALTLVSVASAGIIFVPVAGRFVDLDATPVQVRDRGNQIRIETTGLMSQLDCAGQPPDHSFISLTQNMRLSFDPRDGKVNGTVLGSMDWASPELALRGSIDGVASCFPAGGDNCGAIVVDLDLRNRFFDGSDVGLGLLDQRLLGSLMRDGGTARWVRMEAEVRLGGPQDVVESALHWMTEGESCEG